LRKARSGRWQQPTRQIDVRVIAATNKDLETELRCGRFREDLYYRLSVVNIGLPPLRERSGDVPLLAQALLENAMRHLGKQVKGFTAETMACLADYHWPGNVKVQGKNSADAGDGL
jgi:two-component system response regulator HupR/HoxA